MAYVLIDRTAGCNIGNMTVSGGLAASFDGDANQAGGFSSRFNGSDGDVGKTLAAAKVIGKCVCTGTNDAQEFASGVGQDITLNLYGKDGTAPSSHNDGTLLGTLTYTKTGEISPVKTVTSTDLVNNWDHVWVH